MYAAYLQIMKAVDAANPARSPRHARGTDVLKGGRLLHQVRDQVRHILHRTLDLAPRPTSGARSVTTGESSPEQRKQRARNMASGLDDSIFPRHGI